MSNNIAKVKKKMSIYAKRRVHNVLTGNYGSVFKGRSIDFDDLRTYQYGDDVKDIDWKASARSKVPMIRRYIALRKHNIMIVADAGRNMAALAPSGETKEEVATFAAAVVSYVAEKNGDLVGMTYGNNVGKTRFALKEGVAHIENFLDKYGKSVSTASGDANINALLNYVTKSFRERMFIFIITDVHGAMQINEDLLRRLRVRHEQMVMMVEDINYTSPKFSNKDAVDITNGNTLPRFMRKNRKLRQAEEKLREENQEKVARELKRLGIMSCFLSDTDKAIPEIFKMLEAERHVRR
jgi:uncharacterized protein (DUF58 family)